MYFLYCNVIVWNFAEELITLYFILFGTADETDIILQDSYTELQITRDHCIVTVPYVTQGTVITTQL
jgi:hypothetical protein